MRWSAGAVIAAVLASACVERVELLPCRPKEGGEQPCPAVGAPVVFDGTSTCTAALIAPAARHALCACSSLMLDGAFATNTIDSTRAERPGERIASVGVEGDVDFGATVDIEGTLETSGDGTSRFAHGTTVARTLRSAGAVRGNDSEIQGDAFVGGDGTGEDLFVRGALHVPDGVSVASGVSAGSIVREPVVISPPCGCAEPRLVDARSLVELHRVDNDDAVAGISPDALAHVSHDVDLELPAGQFLLSGIRTEPDAQITLHVRGHAALFVDGDVRLGDSLFVMLDPSASLDLVTAGVLAMERGTLGAPGAAARVRLWLGSPLVQLLDDARLSAVVYAPDSVLSAGGALTVTGALFVRALAASADVTVHFDRAVLEGGAICAAPAVDPVE